MIERKFIKAGVSSFLASKPGKIFIIIIKTFDFGLFNGFLLEKQVIGANIPVLKNQCINTKAIYRLFKDIQ